MSILDVSELMNVPMLRCFTAEHMVVLCLLTLHNVVIHASSYVNVLISKTNYLVTDGKIVETNEFSDTFVNVKSLHRC